MENALAQTILETRPIVEPETTTAPTPTVENLPPPPPASPPPVRRRKRHRVRNFFGRLFIFLASFFVVLQLVAVAFTWITPPWTSYMLQEGGRTAYQFVSLDHVSRYMIAATIAHEDQELGTRAGGFDIEDFKDRAEAFMAGEDDPSGSTIPQQLVKNIYLWKDENALRKGIEAGLSMQFAYTLTDQRILELYLNYAQFGPKLYGVCAASWYYFNTPPWSMAREQAALLMGIVPFPSEIRRGPEGGAYVNKETHPKTWDNLNGAANWWVPKQIKGMGGWEAAVATVGITDTAADHEADRGNQDACSTMPDTVRSRLMSEGYVK
jgi:monofunctional biosynthetic peptidoglycan transglycosylase